MKLFKLISLFFLCSCSMMPLITSPEAIEIEEEIVKDVIKDVTYG